VTPIFHPNISEIGMVCLGGYGTHWAPSVQLDDLCVMLWDMARYHNYDIRSPYNREAALWVASQTSFRFPLDDRPLRDKRAALGRAGIADQPPAAAESNRRDKKTKAASPLPIARLNGATPMTRVLNFIERYTRVFGNDIGPAASTANGNGEARSLVELELMRQMINRSAASRPPLPRLRTAEAEPEVPETANSSQTVDDKIVESTNTNGTDPVQPQDNLIILDENEDSAGRDRVHHDGGEILFIE
jgi:hypothetical protein